MYIFVYFGDGAGKGDSREEEEESVLARDVAVPVRTSHVTPLHRNKGNIISSTTRGKSPPLLSPR